MRKLLVSFLVAGVVGSAAGQQLGRLGGVVFPADRGPKTSATLNSLISAVGNRPTTFIIDSGLWSITNSVTFPTNAAVVVLEGGGFNVSSGKGLRIRGDFAAPETRVFWGSGAVTCDAPIVYQRTAWGTNNVTFTDVMLKRTGEDLVVPRDLSMDNHEIKDVTALELNGTRYTELVGAGDTNNALVVHREVGGRRWVDLGATDTYYKAYSLLAITGTNSPRFIVATATSGVPLTASHVVPAVGKNAANSIVSVIEVDNAGTLTNRTGAVGVTGTVHCVAYKGGRLYVGGDFRGILGNAGARYRGQDAGVWRNNTLVPISGRTTTSVTNGPRGSVYAICPVYTNDVYIGGAFVNVTTNGVGYTNNALRYASGEEVTFIARWHAGRWKAVESADGTRLAGFPYSIIEDGEGGVYVGGSFVGSGPGALYPNMKLWVARYDGTTWSEAAANALSLPVTRLFLDSATDNLWAVCWDATKSYSYIYKRVNNYWGNPFGSSQAVYTGARYVSIAFPSTGVTALGFGHLHSAESATAALYINGTAHTVTNIAYVTDAGVVTKPVEGVPNRSVYSLIDTPTLTPSGLAAAGSFSTFGAATGSVVRLSAPSTNSYYRFTIPVYFDAGVWSTWTTNTNAVVTAVLSALNGTNVLIMTQVALKQDASTAATDAELAAATNSFTLQQAVTKGGTVTSGAVTIDSANARTNTFGGKLTVLGERVQSGTGSRALGAYSHAEGATTTASGTSGHSEGAGTLASGTSSHAEGYNTTASGNYSHAEGNGTTASGESSHAEGVLTVASGVNSHAAGRLATASHTNSYVWSDGTIIGSSAKQQYTVCATGGTRLLGGATIIVEGTAPTNAASFGQIMSLTNSCPSVTYTNLQIIGTSTQKVQQVYRHGLLLSRTVLGP